MTVATPNPTANGTLLSNFPTEAPEYQRLMLQGVTWPQYVTIGDALPEWPRLRITYDRGRLEFTTLSSLHEIYKKRLGRLLEVLAEVFGKEIASAGSMTFRREELERGLEPDDCFWIVHEPQMRASTEWNPAADPPPDLTLEIEISRSALDRMGIYAALRVPEVWRCNGETLHAELLQPDGTWMRSEISPNFPGVPLNGLVFFLQPSATVSYLESIRAFRAWVEQQLSSGQP